MSTSDEMSAQSFQGSADDTEVVPGQEFAERDQTISYGGGGGTGGAMIETHMTRRHGHRPPG
jgi:hypothetical protein